MNHYHLHVVYVPVVEKEVKWTKRCKDPALVGTTKEVIHQVSHSKKWASEKALDKDGTVRRDENGKTVPHCRQRNGTAKIQTVKGGGKGGDFQSGAAKILPGP